MADLPTEEGSVIGWSYWWDGPNFQTAVLTYDTRWPEQTDEDPDPEPLYEGLMWRSTHWVPNRDPYESLTPDEMKNYLVDYGWTVIGKINGRPRQL